ncbi:hypothetical protein M9H77_20553 [Catharanthus roseus]|uniref:Uncharacterized protein n=1 Tax=Catharanthus roseus TaxID=4058 RepID=A0ACC0ALI1_CATRO|nr:hypothetical protein M9H77_20553 [Catharanthus roseus]
MFRQSPGRNQRSKGVKLKHVLQICFLIAICFWLLYQVKHSHDKKKEFDESDAKISIREQTSNEALKLGRKDLLPKVDEAATTSRKQDEEAEEESVGEEEENKHEEEEQQDQKFEDKEDEGKGVGDEELDDREQEKFDAEGDREEEVTEEEKDKEEGDEKEKDSGDTDGHLENESSLEDHEDDDDGTAKSTHEAREEHYKADDASSAVTHETQIVADENVNEDSENSNELSETNKSANETEVDKHSIQGNATDLKTEEREMTENENSHPVNTTDKDEVHDGASKSEDPSLSSNSTSIEQSNDQPPLVKDVKEVTTETDGSTMPNGTMTQSNLGNVAVEGTTSKDGSNFHSVSLDQDDKSSLDNRNHEDDSKLGTSEKTGEIDSSSETTSKPDNSSLPTISEKSMNTSVVSEHSSGSSSTMESSNTNESEKSDNDDGTDGQENDALKTENQVEVQNDPIDSSDSSVAVRTDLETLPDVQTEANNAEEAAEE